jgi:hypothetical protein
LGEVTGGISNTFKIAFPHYPDDFRYNSVFWCDPVKTGQMFSMSGLWPEWSLAVTSLIIEPELRSWGARPLRARPAAPAPPAVAGDADLDAGNFSVRPGFPRGRAPAPISEFGLNWQNKTVVLPQRENGGG